MKIIYIKDDIRNTPLKYIAHGVNCQNAMGSGVAKALFDKWPQVKEQYHSFMNEGMNSGRSPKDFLGTYQERIEVEPDKFVINLFTQLNYGYDGKRYVNYNAILTSLRLSIYRYDIKQMAIPKIGCGLAGGDWNFLEQILTDAFLDWDVELWVYEK